VTAATGRASLSGRPRLLARPATALLTAAAGGAWIVTLSIAQRMGDMPGTMGLGLPVFVSVWTVMMAAMMLPSVGPVASMYARTISGRRMVRAPAFVAGYLLAWAGTGVPAFGLAWLASHVTSGHRVASMTLAVTVFAACGVYQLTPLKDRCLAHCRSPLSQLLHYGSYRGRLRDLRAGAHHGAYCLACCWSLMALLVAFGVMNVVAMVGLMTVVATEKLWRHGVAISRAAGVVALALAALVVWVPGLAPGLRLAAHVHAGGT